MIELLLFLGLAIVVGALMVVGSWNMVGLTVRDMIGRGPQDTGDIDPLDASTVELTEAYQQAKKDGNVAYADQLEAELRERSRPEGSR